MDVCRVFLMVLCLFSSSSIYAQMYKWVDKNGNVIFSDRPPPSKNVSRPSVADGKQAVNTDDADNRDKRNRTEIKIQVQTGVDYPDSIVVSIREKLLNRKFDDLNRLLAQYQQATEKDISDEESLFAAYSAFNIKDESYAPLFDAWQNHSPEHYQPYLARATFNYWLAWKARGGKWSSETSEKQFEAMNTYFSKTTTDLNVVLKKNKKVLPAYTLLIGMMSSGGNHQRMYQVMQAAIAVAPGTYKVRARFLRTLAPRWGGSYKAMRAFVDETREYFPLNPKLKLLQGQEQREAGDMKAIIRSYNAAEERYNEALKYGEEHSVIYRLGKNAYRQKKYPQAVKQLSRAIELYPEDGDYYYWRSKAYGKTGEYRFSVMDIERADLLMPGDEYVAKHRDWLASNMERKGYDAYKNRNPKLAMNYYKLGLRLKPKDAYLHYRKGRVYIDLHDLDAATAEVKKAIELNPDEYSFYKLMDWLLFKKRDMDQIISYWDQYISLHPDDSNAYVERGGAYYHKGDLRSAVRDAKTAADMGNIDGKEAYERFKDRVN